MTNALLFVNCSLAGGKQIGHTDSDLKGLPVKCVLHIFRCLILYILFVCVEGECILQSVNVSMI